MKRRILITGANGMLGGSLCVFFRHRADVIACHRDSKALVEGIQDVSVEITDSQSVAEAVVRLKPDILIHCAALINIDHCEQHPQSAHKINVEGTRNLATSCKKRVLFVYISTDQVYGDTSPRVEENFNLRPVNIYGNTKLLGEQAVKEACPHHLIIRTNIFGRSIKFGRMSSAEWIHSSLSSRTPITLFTDYFFSPVYTRFLGEAIDVLASREASGIYNVGSQTPCSKYDFGFMLGTACGLDTSVIKAGSSNDFTSVARRVSHIDINSKKFEKETSRAFPYKDSILAFASDYTVSRQSFR